MRSHRIPATLFAGLLATAFALPAAAQDAPPKRSEGTYFVELAEIMLNSEDFDLLFLTDDEGGPRAGAAATDVIAELPSNHLEAPTFTLGLNRPNGKSAISVSFQDFDMGSEHIPTDFDRKGYVSTSALLPPGVVYQRQARPLSRFGTSLDDDFIPNWGTDWAYRFGVAEQVSNLTYEHNAFENEKFRLRWIGGITYGKLQQEFAHAMAFSQEYGPAGFGSATTREEQDFLLVMANVSTTGLGPKLGLDGRWLLDKKKKWSLDARVELAIIPETTSANYDLNMVDASPELVVRRMETDGAVSISIMPANEPPVTPGLPTEALISFSQPFAATMDQQDFTETVLLATGRVGFRYQATSHISVGLDLWQQRWMNVLSNAGMLATINREATFDYIPARPGPAGGLNPDPQLQFDQAIVHVPRLTEREDFVFDGINLNLNFQF